VAQYMDYSKGVLYLQTVTQQHNTRANLLSFTTARKVRPSFRPIFMKPTNAQHSGMCTYLAVCAHLCGMCTSLRYVHISAVCVHLCGMCTSLAVCAHLCGMCISLAICAHLCGMCTSLAVRAHLCGMCTSLRYVHISCGICTSLAVCAHLCGMCTSLAVYAHLLRYVHISAVCAHLCGMCTSLAATV